MDTIKILLLKNFCDILYVGRNEKKRNFEFSKGKIET